MCCVVETKPHTAAHLPSAQRLDRHGPGAHQRYARLCRGWGVHHDGNAVLRFFRPRHRRDCHFADIHSPSPLKHPLVAGEGGAACRQSRRRLLWPPVALGDVVIDECSQRDVCVALVQLQGLIGADNARRVASEGLMQCASGSAVCRRPHNHRPRPAWPSARLSFYPYISLLKRQLKGEEVSAK